MVDPEIKMAIRKFFNAAEADRKAALRTNISKELTKLRSRGMEESSEALNRVGQVYAEELKTRSFSAWRSIKQFFENGSITFDKDSAAELEKFIKDHIVLEEQRLSREIQSRFMGRPGPLGFYNSISQAIASSKNNIFPIISADILFFTDIKAFNKPSIKMNRESPYVDSTRIEELESIVNPNYDFARLVMLCKEMNFAHKNDCFMSIAMLMRTIIDHIPPVFGKTNFSEVANNYQGTASFKKAMQSLQSSLRNVADSHLHTQIRRQESLPNFSQVNFQAQLDLLLSEIVRISK